MIAYPDTSFLCALYRQQDNSAQAVAYVQGLKEPLHVTGLVLFELRQSLRLQVWLHQQNRRHGFAESHCDQALAELQSDLDSGFLVAIPAEMADVQRIADRLSATHTKKNGHRAMDILHVATALHLGAQELLSFDENQRSLALAEGLHVKP